MMVVAVAMLMRVMVAVLNAMDDRAAAEEKQRLKYRMRNQVEHRRHVSANADRRHHEAELRDRRISQHAFDIPLTQRDVTRHERSARAHQRDDQADDIAAVIQLPQEDIGAHQYEHAGGHHRRRMN